MGDKENLLDKQKLKDWMNNWVSLIKDHFNEAQSSEKEGTLIVLGAVIAAFDVLYEQIEDNPMMAWAITDSEEGGQK